MVSAEEQVAAGSSDRQRIAKAAAIIMVGTVLSRILGLVREQVTSYLWGTTDQVAAFTLADNIHTILFDLVISGMMQAALVPVLSAYAAPEHREELRRIVGALLVLAMIVIGAIVAVMMLFAPQLVWLMTALGGDTQVHSPDTIPLTIELVRIILPAVLLLSISTILMSTLYALQRFTRPALSLAVRNAAIVAAALALGRTAFEIRSLAVGIVVGALLLIAIQLPGLRDAMPRPNFGFRHPAIRRILLLYLPIFVGLISNTIALVIDRNLAFNVDAHALGAMRYATALNQMILGIVAAATSLAALPTLSRHFSSGDEAAYQRTLSNGLKMVTVMVVPATFGMAAIAWPAVDLLFFHGATDLEGARAILTALLCYLPGTFFAAFDQVLIFGYYARQNTRTPVIVGVLAVGVFLLTAFSLVGPLGMAGLVLANSAQFMFHAIVMWLIMRRALGQVGDATVGRTLRVCVAVGALMAVAVFLLAQALQAVPLGTAPGTALDLARRAVAVAIPIAVGAAIYAGGLHLLGVDEIRQIWRGVMRRLGRAAA
ncbi:MAG: murein biosynthesis integral membrane protein MurJ [Sphaerobacter thermophilus]|uniref:Probable lipid II flippase MurJ n=1 Tax=Sphaerobacter thermophilus (strain ATCC 49802 / DSM 20745 / KCCM 41009 / NCIMB 13125 / S 6022) TaxID=479434 RepID=D1C4L9_SPHTD|nr:murein biosynthesis integral membrane protein MurJ [Sphaerobacter thermophilus]ACZ39186.1 integral membrane protein MviN [Sphaerobacter thermophilus DSM 20745]